VPSKKGCHTKQICRKKEVSLRISKCAPKKGQQKHRKIWSNVPKQKKLAKNLQRSISCVLKQGEKARKKFLKSPFESAPRKNVKNVPKQFLKCARTGKKIAKKKVTSHLTPCFLLWSPVSNFHPQFWDFTDNRKQGTKSGQGMGLGRTLWITLLFESMKVCSSFD